MYLWHSNWFYTLESKSCELLACVANGVALFQMLDGIVGEFELNIGRFASMLIFVAPVLLKQKPNMMVSKKNILPVLVECLLLFWINYINYAATTYIPSGTVNVCYMISYLISTVLISVAITLYTERRINVSTILCESVTILLLSLGIILVIQPEFIFVAKPPSKYQSFCNPFRFDSYNMTEAQNSNASVLLPSGADYPLPSKYTHLGYIYSFAGGLINSLLIFCAKHIYKTDSPLVVCTWMAIVDTLFSVLCTGLFETFVLPRGILCNSVLLFHALFTGGMTVFMCLGAEFVPSTDLSVISSFAIPLVFIFQFTVLKNASPAHTNANALAIVASAFVSLVSFLKPLIECIRIHRKTEIPTWSNYWSYNHATAVS